MHYPNNRIDASPTALLQLELRRLGQQPAAFDHCVDGVYPFTIGCVEPAELVLERARAVMLIVVEISLTRCWPPLDEWRTRLPGWFIDACLPDFLEDGTWHGELRWPLESWIGNMLPPDVFNEEDGDPRVWYWWDAEIVAPHLIRGAIELLEPSPDTYRWLFNAAGAGRIDEGWA